MTWLSKKSWKFPNEREQCDFINRVLILSYQAKLSLKTAISGVAELGDDFAQFIIYFHNLSDRERDVLFILV